MQPENQPSTAPINNNSSPQPPTGFSGQTIIQPSSELKEELQTQKQAQPTVTTSTVSLPKLVQTDSSQPQLPVQDQMPVGMSASQLGLNTSHKRDFEWGRLLKKIVVPAVVLLVLSGGFLFTKNSLTGLSTKSLSNGGYTYKFKFNKSASEVQLSDGSAAYKYLNNIVAGVKPVNNSSLTSCSQIGSQWQQAFIVRLNGTQLPVCTPNNSSYMMLFTAQNHNHLFFVNYSTQQTSSVYPTLQSIFGSVTVLQ